VTVVVADADLDLAGAEAASRIVCAEGDVVDPSVARSAALRAQEDDIGAETVGVTARAAVAFGVDGFVLRDRGDGDGDRVVVGVDDPVDADRHELVVGRPEAVGVGEGPIAHGRQVGELDEAERRAAVARNEIAVVTGLRRLDHPVRAERARGRDETEEEGGSEEGGSEGGTLEHAAPSEPRANRQNDVTASGIPPGIANLRDHAVTQVYTEGVRRPPARASHPGSGLQASSTCRR
jgi:hypothetical protein